MSDEELRTHPLVGKIVQWSDGENVLVGPATHYDPDDDELFIVPDGLTHGHYWVPASACREHTEPTDDEREALEDWSFEHRPILSMHDGSIAACKCMDRVFLKGKEGWDQHIADSLIAAGFRRGAPAEPAAREPTPLSRLKDALGEGQVIEVPELQAEPTDALVEEALAWIGRAWDDGNATGLDGWVGPGRGAGEVDSEAQHARTRLIHKADAALRAALTTKEGQDR